MPKPKRCNEHYKTLNKMFAEGESERRIFATGWMSGLAEKVYMGACRAAMVSPLRIDAEWMARNADRITKEFGLYLYIHSRSFRTEIWFCCDVKTQAQLAAYINDNNFRAIICGLDMSLYDPKYPLEAPK